VLNNQDQDQQDNDKVANAPDQQDEPENLLKSAKHVLQQIHILERWWRLAKIGQLPPLWCVGFAVIFGVALFITIIYDNFVALAASVIPALVGPYKAISDAYAKIDPAFQKAIDFIEDEEKDFEAPEDSELSRLNEDLKILNGEADSIQKRIWLVQGEPLDRVVSNRLESSNYEKDLGTVHQAQMDIERISESMLKKGREGDNDSFPRGEPRIFLFIDDLDRCPPRKGC